MGKVAWPPELAMHGRCCLTIGIWSASQPSESGLRLYSIGGFDHTDPTIANSHEVTARSEPQARTIKVVPVATILDKLPLIDELPDLSDYRYPAFLPHILLTHYRIPI